MAGRIKVSTGGKLYFSRVITRGRVQMAFKRQIGDPVGACVAKAIPRGSHPGRAAVLAAIKGCAPRKGAVKLAI